MTRGVKRKKEEVEERRKKRKIDAGRGMKRKWEGLGVKEDEEEVRRVKLRRKEVVIKANE